MVYRKRDTTQLTQFNRYIATRYFANELKNLEKNNPPSNKNNRTKNFKTSDTMP